jgi:hypothetical protein
VTIIASYIALWCLVGFLTLLAIGLVYEITILRRSVVRGGVHIEPPLVIGSRAPKFSAIDARSGGKVASDIFLGRPSVILFISPHCSICRHLVSTLGPSVGGQSFSFVAVCGGSDSDCRELLDSFAHSNAPVLLDA